MSASQIMGIAARNNDELVDSMLSTKHIWDKKIEYAFRSVDRGAYFQPAYRKTNAYKDFAWSCGGIHLSAPSIYSTVLSTLDLQPGMSFLNMGSGTGYLNTVAGLLLKQHGTNHGVELNKNCVKYAYERLEEFKQNSQALDQFDFCEPVFVQGNCLSLIPDRQYDRVYCGAACPEAHIEFIKKFVRVGGKLVVPFGISLMCMSRMYSTWDVDALFYASFETLVIPTPEEQNLLHLPACNPRSLQELCRGRIRSRLREKIWHEHGEVVTERAITHQNRPSANALDKFVRDSRTTYVESKQLLTLFLGYHNSGTPTIYSEDMWADLHEIGIDNVEAQHTAESPNVNAECTDGTNTLDQEDNAQEVLHSADNRSFYRVCEAKRSGSERFTPDIKIPEKNTSESECMDEVSAPCDSTEYAVYGHYVDHNRFTAHMKEKIRQLPLPLPLKSYVNYNREL